VLSAHREENIDSDRNFAALINAINKIAEVYGKRIIFSTHPRTMKRIKGDARLQLDPLIEIIKPFGFFDYIKLQMNAFCVLSDSGTITEESSVLNFPAVTIREAHERPEGMDVGTLIMSGMDSRRVVESIDIVTNQFDDNERAFDVVPDYQVDNVSKKVVRIIQSYTEYINQKVWYKAE
jgi:UDP-N-acetylglucosamine 2-epimerase (non-hydrolysing)